jgi:hypothetical protein
MNSSCVDTAEEFSQQSSIGGFAYIFSNLVVKADRFFWLIICTLFGCLAIFLTINTYQDWRENQVITTLSSTSKPVSDLKFPTVTFCSPGLHMDLVEKVVFKNFEDWASKKEYDGENANDEQIAEFAKEVFQIEDTNTNIFDVLDTMLSDNVDSSVAANGVRENELACRQSKDKSRSGDNTCMLINAY